MRKERSEEEEEKTEIARCRFHRPPTDAVLAGPESDQCDDDRLGSKFALQRSTIILQRT